MRKKLEKGKIGKTTAMISEQKQCECEDNELTYSSHLRCNHKKNIPVVTTTIATLYVQFHHHSSMAFHATSTITHHILI